MVYRETDFVLDRPHSEERERMVGLIRTGKARLSTVYLIRCNDMYKIGYSNVPIYRLTGLQIGNPYELELLWEDEVPNFQQIEEGLHKRFSSKHVRGEWFKLDKEDLDFIFSLK